MRFCVILMIIFRVFLGCGIVEFKHKEDAKKAVEILHQHEISGRKIMVREERETDRRRLEREAVPQSKGNSPQLDRVTIMVYVRCFVFAYLNLSPYPFFLVVVHDNFRFFAPGGKRKLDERDGRDQTPMMGGGGGGGGVMGSVSGSSGGASNQWQGLISAVPPKILQSIGVDPQGQFDMK